MARRSLHKEIVASLKGMSNEEILEELAKIFDEMQLLIDNRNKLFLRLRPAAG